MHGNQLVTIHSSPLLATPHCSIKQDFAALSSPAPGSLLRAGTLRSCPAKLPADFQLLSQNREGRQLIVIIVHPSDRDFVSKRRMRRMYISALQAMLSLTTLLVHRWLVYML